jgi:choline dehydrogenase-like flavoprotein
LFIDLRTQPGSIETEADVAVIGAGAAGITLTRELASAGCEVCLIEAGGFRADAQTQSLYRGESTGLPYGALDETRVRYFGGATNREGWGGWSKPLDPIDFETRSWAPHSGWPIDLATLEPYYRLAHEICELGPYDYELESWRKHLQGDLGDLPLDGERVETGLAQLSPPTRFGKRYRADLDRAESATIYLGANVTEILTTPDASEATGVTAVSFGGNRLHVRSRIVVVAAGGIENARILLLSGGKNSPGLGNEHDLVGRYFMDHPRFEMGTIEFSDRQKLPDLYDPYYKFRKRDSSKVGVYDETVIAGSLNLTPQYQREAELLNYRSWIVPTYPWDQSPAIESFKRLYIAASERTVPSDTLAQDLKRMARHPSHVMGWTYCRLARPRRFVKACELVNVIEAEQTPESRVMLSDQVDTLGLRRVRIHWHVGNLVRRTLADAHRVLDEDLRQSGVGRLVDPFQVDDEARFRAGLSWTWHHMGTTRMHEDPTQGVVDSNTRLHGTSNVYVAGSSVFPTPGNDMPTLTIVALTLRLADHLKETLRLAGAPQG